MNAPDETLFWGVSFQVTTASSKVNGSMVEVINFCPHILQSSDPFGLAEAGG